MELLDLFWLIFLYSLPITGMAILSYTCLFLYLRKFKQINISWLRVNINLDWLLSDRIMRNWVFFIIPMLNLFMTFVCLLSGIICSIIMIISFGMECIQSFLIKISQDKEDKDD